MLERVAAGVGRLADAGPPSVIVERAPAEAAEALGLDRVLLSRHRRRRAGGRGAVRRGGAVRARLARARARRARLPAGRGRGAAAPRGRCWWRRASRRPARVRRGAGLARLRGRADRARGARDRLPARRPRARAATRARARPRRAGALRRGLRARLRARGAAAAPARAARGAAPGRELGRRARRRARPTAPIDLAPTAGAAAEVPERPAGDPRLRDLLTRREVDVLEHMVARRDERRHRARPGRLRGHGQVPRQEHPAQAHVSNRAEATSRYLRLSLRPAPEPSSSSRLAAVAAHPRSGSGPPTKSGAVGRGSRRWRPGAGGAGHKKSTQVRLAALDLRCCADGPGNRGPCSAARPCRPSGDR